MKRFLMAVVLVGVICSISMVTGAFAGVQSEGQKLLVFSGVKSFTDGCYPPRPYEPRPRPGQGWPEPRPKPWIIVL